MDIHYSVAINPHPAKGELTVLFSGHSETSPEHKVGPLVHDYHLVHLVLSGRGIFRTMGKEHQVRAGGAFFIYPGELSSYESDKDEPWRYRWIGFKGSSADDLLYRLGLSPHNPVVQEAGSKAAALFRRIERTLTEGSPVCDLQAGGWMRAALGEIAKHHAPAPVKEAEPDTIIKRQVEQAIRWLTLQYSQPVSIEQLSQSLGYHRTHLSKMFKLHTGLSPMAYLLRIRMERAKLLLAEQLTVEQVASSVGFADPLYFSKQFKKYYGLSPTEYRTVKLPANRFDCTPI